MGGYTIERYHDISCGHRVHGHESKCAHLHGHNYRITFTCAPGAIAGVGRRFFGKQQLDEVGRVVDFSVVKSTLCQWLEDNWDHKMLLWEQDPILPGMLVVAPQDIVRVPFNPTAEAMAQYLAETVAPPLLQPHGVRVTCVRVQETRKCSASYEVRA